MAPRDKAYLSRLGNLQRMKELVSDEEEEELLRRDWLAHSGLHHRCNLVSGNVVVVVEVVFQGRRPFINNHRD